MRTQQSNSNLGAVNAHGTPIRQITVYTPERVTELFFQQVDGSWFQFKRVVHAIH